MKKMNVRAIVLLVLSLAMLTLATSCSFEELMASMPWAKDDSAETSDTTLTGDSNETPDTTTVPGETTTKPKEEIPVPDVEHKEEMSDDDFIHGTWGETSQK